MKNTSLLFLNSLLLGSFFSNIVHAQNGVWTWMNGSQGVNPPAIYGTMGISDPFNTPQGLYGCITWKDLNGNFWLFGGADYWAFPYNTLWKYEPSNNSWTWVRGDIFPYQPGVYGTKGIPSPLNDPGSRAYGALSWVDANNNLWLYGGDGMDLFADAGNLSDLWKYSVANNEWTWVNGDSSVNLPATYSDFQIFSSGNHPGMRMETTANWQDAAGNFWFFGGCTNNFSFPDDLWKYDPSIDQWAWMWGGNFNTPPNYGIKGIFSPTNSPGARCTYSAWKDFSGKLYLLGGTVDFFSGPHYADLWAFDPAINQWAWISGSSFPFSQSVADSFCNEGEDYFPGARFENRASGTTISGAFLLFGGASFHYPDSILGDLWSYNPVSNTWQIISGTLASNTNSQYGNLGVASILNRPSGRAGAVSWVDDESNFWLFGGTENGPVNGLVRKNDLWKFTFEPCNIPLFNSGITNLCEKFCTDFFDLSTNNATAWQWIFPGGNPSTSSDQNPTNVCYNNPGNYDVTLITTNANGTDTITLADYIIIHPTPPFPIIFQVGDSLISSPAAAYQWQYDAVDIPGATNQSILITQEGYYTVVISDSNGCKNSTTLFVTTTGIEDITDHVQVLVYPNPSNGIIAIELMNIQMAESISLRLINTLGQLIISSEEKISSKKLKKEIDLTQVANGIYHLEIRTMTSVVRKKLIISN